jgi:hypothetical protein
MSIEHSPAKQRRPGVGHNGGPPLTVEQLQVITIKQWALMNALSMGTAKRMLRDGRGPKTVQLSSRRIGIRMVDAQAWQEERLRP